MMLDNHQPRICRLGVGQCLLAILLVLLYGGGQRMQQLHNNLWSTAWACAVVLKFMLYRAAKNTFLEDKYNHMITFC